MTKTYELPNGRGMIAEFDDNGISKITEQALDSLIQDLNYYADKVCDIEQIRAEIEQEYKVESEHPYGQGLRRALEIIDRKGERK